MNFKNISFLFILSVLVFNCEDFVTDPVLNLGNAPAIASPGAGTSFVLQEEQAEQVLTNMEWSAADFGFSAAITYNVEIDKAGNGFADARTLGTSNNTSLEITQERLNGLILAMGVEEALPTDLDLRVIATVSDEVDALISSTFTITATPYIIEVVFPQLQVPGSYQGWDPANNSTIIFSPRSDAKYEGFVFFGAESTLYKFTDGPSWDTNWGDNEPDGILDPGGTDIAAMEGVGMYRLNVDLNELTHTAVRTNWGLIGDATPGGWDADTDMTYDETSGTLKLSVDLGTGFIKFRANDAWDINLGDNDTNGSLEYGGADIPINDAGNYTIELILNTGRYTYKLTKN